jgi:hypothetical protein
MYGLWIQFGTSICQKNERSIKEKKEQQKWRKNFFLRLASIAIHHPQGHLLSEVDAPY